MDIGGFWVPAHTTVQVCRMHGRAVACPCQLALQFLLSSDSLCPSCPEQPALPVSAPHFAGRQVYSSEQRAQLCASQRTRWPAAGCPPCRLCAESAATVQVPACILHQDTNSYAEPEQYIPERWLPDVSPEAVSRVTGEHLDRSSAAKRHCCSSSVTAGSCESGQLCRMLQDLVALAFILDLDCSRKDCQGD